MMFIPGLNQSRLWRVCELHLKPERSPSSQSASELTEILLHRDNVRIERIVSHGHSSPPGSWYDQTDNEWVMVLSGKARLMFEGEAEPRALAPGDSLDIPAHRRHRVDWTDPEQDTVWLAVFYS